jgi:outer membrane receptor protein involved in Fe transport
VILFGAQNQALVGVEVQIDGRTASTDDVGGCALDSAPGMHTLRLAVPLDQLPEAPVSTGPFIIDVPDVHVGAHQETQLIVTLSDSGAVLTLDVLAPDQSQTRSLTQEFEKAQTERAKGTVQGFVTAIEDGKPIAGARVYVRGAPVEAESADDGTFSLELPANTYLLSVIHPRFSTQSVPDVVVEGGRVTSLRVELSPASVELEELVVTAPHIEGGIATLLSERRETSAVADVIGAEQMSRSGDSSAASALARVTGLTVVDGKYVIVRGMGERYSSMTLNRLQVPSPEPTRRVVPLDIFPTGVLESVVVQKTFSPDMPGEFGGGIVQVRSRGYPDDLLLNVSLSSTFNTQTHLRENLTYEGGKLDFLGIDDGTRGYPADFPQGRKLKLRTRLSPPGEDYSADELTELGQSLPVNYETRRVVSPLDFGITTSVGNRFDLGPAKIGFVAATGYKSEYAAVRNAISRTVRTDAGSTIPRDDFRVDQSLRTISSSAFLDWGVELSEAQKLKFTSMLLRQTEDSTTYRAGWDDNLGRDTRRYRLSWVERQVLMQQASGSHRFEKLNDFEVQWRYAYARAKRIEPDRRDYQYLNVLNTDEYAVESGTGGNERLFGDLNDATHEGSIDLIQPFAVWSNLTAKLKAGGLAYARSREAEVRRFQFNVRLPEEERSLAPNDLFATERIGNGPGFLEFREVTFPSDFYDASMNIEAGYGMLELPLLESLEIMGGARIEHANIEVSTFDPFAAEASPVAVELDDTDILPASTLTWRFIEDFQFRAGYSRTVNRPDLRELSPNQFFDVENNITLQGSPTLKRALISNYDARVEWYYSTDEVFSLGGFFKTFDDPIETTITPTDSQTILGLANTRAAQIMGVEAEGRKRFDFVDSALDPLYLAGNFSLIASEVEIDLIRGGTYKRPLQSQSPWVLNAQLGWDDTLDGGTGTSAALLYNVAGRRIRAVGNPDQNIPDQYEEPFHRLDFVLSQNLRHGFKIGAKAQNILNPEQKWKQGDVLVRRFRRGVDLAVSLAWSY